MSEIVTPILYQLGVGGITGFIVGYAVKKLLTIVAVFAGIFFLLLIYLGHTGIIYVNYDKLTQMLEGFRGSLGGAPQWIIPIIANLPFAGSFIVGIGLGLKKG